MQNRQAKPTNPMQTTVSRIFGGEDTARSRTPTAADLFQHVVDGNIIKRLFQIDEAHHVRVRTTYVNQPVK